MIALLALVIAQASVPGTPSASALPMPVSSSQAPESARPASTPEDAVIGNSGSTNAAGYTIVVHRDGSAEIDQAGRVTQGTVPRAQTAWLFAKLQAGPLSNMISGHCMRSMSFGSTTRVTYRGETTGDLGCAPDPDARELKRTVDVIAGRLGVTLRPRRAILRI